VRRLIATLFCLFSIASCGLAGHAWALDNGVALTPPMGWNSWNRFGCDVDERVIRGTADALVASGMRDAGYKYVIVDDCWEGPRDANGALTSDPRRFPSGIKALADYVHAKGLKFGLYSDAGERTCQNRPGSLNHEQQDAQTFAAWGVDYVKYDWCWTRGQYAPDAYNTMSRALAATGRPIVFSICEWGLSDPWDWAPPIGNLWRTAGDIADCFDCSGRRPEPGGPGRMVGQSDEKGPPPPFIGQMGLGVLEATDLQAGLAFAAGPGHWNDPDMLQVGNGGMTEEEDRAQFSLWAVLAAPLIAGNDLPHMSDQTRAILTNREVIAVDQDPAGIEGTRVVHTDFADVWSRRLADGGRAVALLNRGIEPRQISVSWAKLKLAPGAAKVRDLWRGRDIGSFNGSYQALVPPHGVVLIRVTQG